MLHDYFRIDEILYISSFSFIVIVIAFVFSVKVIEENGVDCNVNISLNSNVSSAIIESPNFPLLYPSNINCTFVIQTKVK